MILCGRIISAKLTTSCSMPKLSGGYIQDLGDDYSYYMTANEYVTYYNRIHGKMSGIGISAALNPDTGFISVAEVNAGSPAQNAGLRKGDRSSPSAIRRLRRIIMTQWSKTWRAISSPALISPISAAVRKKQSNVMRGYSVKSVYHEIIGTTGYIRITSFYENTATQCRRRWMLWQRRISRASSLMCAIPLKA